ncbi:MAG: AsmA family protein [Candidatus Acidiferrales bacterium]
MKKKPLIIIGAIVVIVLIILLALPLFVNANQFKPALESQLTTALGRQVSIGNISLAIFSGGVTVDNVSIADDAAFSRSPFLQAKQLAVGVELIPLIFSKKLEVRSLTIVEPQVTLLKSPSGVWNFSTLGTNKATSPTPAAPATPSKAAPGDASPGATQSLLVQKLSLTNGKIVVGTVGSKARPSEYDDVNLDASDLSYTTQFPFTLSAKGPGNAALKLDGKAGPMNPTDASKTPLNATIDVQHLDLATTGFLDPSAGIAGMLNFDGSLSSDGSQVNSKGTVKGANMKLSKDGAPSTVPLNVNYDTVYDLQQETGTLNQGDIHIGGALARLTGTYNTSGETASVQMKLNGQAMPVADLEGALPAVGVALPSGASLKSGTLNLNLTLSGPVDKLTITGPVNLANAKLANFSLGSKLSVLSAFTGHASSGGSDTEIQTLSTNLRVDQTGTQASDLNMVIPTIGTLTGNGNVSPAGALNCKMVAHLGSASASASNTGASGTGGQVASALSGFGLGGGSSKGSSGGIPFTIQGTTKNPVFVPDVAGMAEGLIKGRTGGATGTQPTNSAAGILGGILGRKKTP